MIEVKQLAALPGHQNPIYAIEASQKPGIFFTAGNDKGVVEWSLKKMAHIKVLLPVKTSVYALHAPASAPVLAIGERSGQVNIFDFEQQKVTAILNHHEKPIFDIQSVSSKKELLIASEDGSVSVWNMNNSSAGLDPYALLYSFKVSTEMVRSISVSPDEKQVAFGAKDNRIRIYSLTDYSLLHDFEAHSMPVTSLKFSPDGRYLISGGRDAQLKIWDSTSFTLVKTIPAHLFAIYDIVFHPSKPYFATASRDKSIKIWDARDFSLKKVISLEKGYSAHRLSINKIAWEPYSNYLISVGDDKMVMVWDIQIEE
ncbi:MAG TPA: WD40 repeat domain-containing protein [Daejeonella sp.]|nr:WD40 repeat domain-containing protein [Daejeonella sp.]